MTQSPNTSAKCSSSFHQVHFILTMSTSQMPIPPPLMKNMSQSQDVAIFPTCTWSLDSSHIPCTPPITKCAMYHNCKGFLSQNCIFACSFDLKFVFGYTGWEGSAMDNQVWEAALECRLNILDGYYFLADAGYPGDP